MPRPLPMPSPADADTPAVTLLRPEQAEAMVRASEANAKLPWSDDAVAAAWELTHGHPYLLQHLSWHVMERTQDRAEVKDHDPRTKRCTVCGHTSPIDSPKCATCASDRWEHVQRARPAVTREDVEAAVPATIDASRKTLERLWEGMAPGVRAVAWVLAKAGPAAMPEDRLRRVLAGRRLLEAARDPAKAPRSIEGWDLLESVNGGYRLRVDLFRRWIAALEAPEGAEVLAEDTLHEPGKHPEAPSRARPAREARPAGEPARAPAAATEGHGAGAPSAKPRMGRSVAMALVAAALGAIFVLIGWLARGGLGGPSPAPSGSAAPSATGPAVARTDGPGTADDDGKNLPPGQGYLVVDSPTESGVYAFGTFLGLTGRKLEVNCGTKFLRLGDPPPEGVTPPRDVVWRGPGKSTKIACKAITRVSLTATK